MHSLLHLEVMKATHPGDAPPSAQTYHRRALPPPGRPGLRRPVARVLAVLAARLDGEAARRAIAS